MKQPETGKVIQLVGSDNMKPVDDLQGLRSYWDSMRVNGAVPRRTDVDPRNIQSLLEYALIIEKIAPGLARLRIAGQHLSDLMGMEVRGMPITSFVTPGCRDQLAHALTELFEHPAIVSMELSAPGSLRQPAVSARLMLLPLSSDLGDVSRALGCLISPPNIKKTPLRFDIDHVNIEPLTVGALPQPERQLRGLAEPAAAFGHADTDEVLPTERSYLRLVR